MPRFDLERARRMIMLRLNSGIGSALCALGLATSGCAAAMPPNELVLARQTYGRAAAGPAQTLAPAELHTAQEALAKAEQAFGDEPSTMRTRDLAYVAERKAELAETKGALESDSLQKAKAESDVTR